MVRRSSFAIAAALTSVALTTTAAVSVTGNNGASAGAPGTAAAAERSTQPGGVAVGSAVVTDPEVRSASEKADAVLTDAAYVTSEGDLNTKNRKRVRAAAEDLRTMLDKARDAAGTTVAEARPATAASRTVERISLSERAAAGAEKTADAPGSTPEAAATEPTNLAGAATGATAISEQDTTDLPILDTPLAESVDVTADAKEADAKEADAKSDPKDADATSGARTAAATAAPSAAAIEKVTTSLQRLITKADGDAVVSVKAGPTPAEIAAAKEAAEERREARAARAAEREAEKARQAAAARAAEAKEMAKAAKSYGNGQIPSNVLCDLSWAQSEQLRCDAAASLEDLNGAFRAAFGRNLDLTDGYRSYGEQVSVAATKGALAAVPGTSNHGLGQAVDLSGGIESFGTAEHTWMVDNAGKHGWKLPGWAQAGGSKPEAWHWEYGTSY
ncbi:M15 family metallopeptidase [Promicromonospora vindobonensis]|uniref:M15 family metallopeptidase n=1 Tax=Promicromonospora vindobonensis TaxID=195748 RepID=A0ABW5VS00_9MICO